MMWRLSIFLCALALSSPAVADRRIQNVAYNPDKIVVVHAAAGVQTMIEFGPDERLENIALGDASAWQVTPNKRANLVFLKPLSPSARTNMTIVTDRRRYLFDLITAKSRLAPLYVLRFTYPEELALSQALLADAAAASDPAAQKTPPDHPPRPRTLWQAMGDRVLFPELAYDDGVATYIQWNAKADFPAIFAEDADGSMGPANFTIKDDMIVIDGIAPRYILRIGKASAVLTRSGKALPANMEQAK